MIAWGVFVRLLGVMYAITFLSLDREILALAGSRGITPIAAQLARIRADFPGWRRFVHFPTLLWIDAGDRALRVVTRAGVLAAILVIVGGPSARVALAACFALHLSLDLAADLLYPWDCVLFEAGALAMFLPAPLFLPHLGLAAMPHPAIAWAFRFLAFRVLFGFGKYKFFGPGKTDWAYLHGFLCSQPLPTPIGLLAGRLPLGVLRLAYAGVFVAEVIAPFFFFVDGPARTVAAAIVACLMIAIQACGSFGFFNAIVVVLVIPMFAPQSSFSFAPFRIEVVVASLAFVLGVVQLPFNSWVTRAWPFWPAIDRAARGPLRPLLALVRVLTPFRLVHAYGVFGPESGPPAKWVPIIEGTIDGETWRVYPYRFMPCEPSSRARFVAPFCPRIDHALIYDAYGIRLSAHLGSVFSLGHPYRFSRAAWFDRVMQRVLEGSPEVLRRFAADPFDGRAPLAVRARLVMLLPSTSAHASRTGERWIARHVLEHAPTLASGSDVFADWLRAPESFHPDDIVWQRRAPSLAPLLEAARAGDPACITREDAATLWAAVDASPSRRESAVARAALALCERERVAPGTRGGPSDFEIHLAALTTLASRDSFDEALRNPEALRARARDPAAVNAGLDELARWWPASLRYHAARARLRDVMMRGAAREVPAIAPGFLRLLPRLAERFPPIDPEHLPTFVRLATGEYALADPPPGARIARAHAGRATMSRRKIERSASARASRRDVESAASVRT